jgi:hypothetical protein
MIDAEQAAALAEFGVKPEPAPRRGMVFLSDGATPAAGATVYVFQPSREWPNSSATADASGRFTYRLDPHRLGPSATATEQRPALIAVSPGAEAPALAMMPDENEPRELRLVLGPPTRLRGSVTIGGERVGTIGNRILVRITRQDGSPLDRYFDAEFNPSADGSFDRAGLAPGTYRLQAALDRIWLSTTRAVEVGSETGETATIALDIGRPGVPSVVRCVDAAGKPVAGATFSLSRPDGPLTNRLWPPSFTADAAGLLQLPPLEAGPHFLPLPNRNARHELQVPPISASGKEPFRLTIALE